MTEPKIGGIGWVERVKIDDGEYSEISFDVAPCSVCGKTRLLVSVDDGIGICEHDLYIRFQSQATARL